MAESSILWSTNGTGDGAADITSTQWVNFFSMLFLRDNATEGVAVVFRNSLAVSSTGANNIRVASGGAVVRGFLYDNTDIVDKTVSSPAADTGFRVVLRADWTLQTVRIVVVLNTTGLTDPPALTQVFGTTWEISLATGVITSAGAITGLTDARTFMHYNTAVSTAMLEADSVTNPKIADDAVDTAQIADNAITNPLMANDSVNTNEIVNLAVTTGKIAEDAVTKAKLANVYTELTDHQGNNVADWEQPGGSNFAVARVTMQNGSVEIIMPAPDDGEDVTVTFPAAFGNKPNISLTVQKLVDTGTNNPKGGYVTCTALSATQMTIALWRRDADVTADDLTAQVHWQAWQGDNTPP